MKQILLLTSLLGSFCLGAIATAEPATQAHSSQQAMNIANDLKGNLHILKNGKFAPTQVDQSIDYYIVYYTASW